MLPLILIALRNVVRNRRRSLITLFAVFLALTVMVTLRGVLNGLQASIREAIIHGQVGAVQVHKKGFLQAMQGGGLDLDIPADEAFLSKIRGTPHVTAAAPRIPFGGMVNANDETVFALFMALDPVSEVKVCPRRFERLESGAALDPKAPTGSDFTAALLHRIGVGKGEKVALLTNDKDGVMNAAEVEVAGAFGDLGALAQDKKLAFLPLGVAQELLRMPGRATEVAVGVDDLKNVDAVKAALQAQLGDGYEVSSWHDVAGFIDDIIKNQDTMLGIITDTFLVMALLGIANTMLMSVRERTREIGTMMSVGVRRRQILGLFLVEAALLGLAGGMIGSGLGASIIHHYGTDGFRMRMAGSSAMLQVFPFVTLGYVLKTFALAALGAALASLYPALRASRLRPVEALSQAA